MNSMHQKISPDRDWETTLRLQVMKEKLDSIKNLLNKL